MKYLRKVKLLTFALYSVAILFHMRPAIAQHIVTGADQPDLYLPLLEGKSVGVVVNPTSIRENGLHLVDALIENKIAVTRIFSPEHGFRGNADAGASVASGKDEKTGIEIFSLHGEHRKPSGESLSDIDIIVFDIQDVGARFYTYISTMHLVMEACAATAIPLVILDRPNPNGHYVDGPVLEPAEKSFLGMHPIPVVHGLTVGELALMINGESWLEDGQRAELSVVPVKGWEHSMPYDLPVKPSPNLPNSLSVTVYPSLCFFEQTIMSIGRGTSTPFQVIGHPDYEGDFSFTPTAMAGASSPKLNGQRCKGISLQHAKRFDRLDLSYLIDAYTYFNDRNQPFFLDHMSRLAGTKKLQRQIMSGMSATEISLTWQEELDRYKAMRSQYLLYD